MDSNSIIDRIIQLANGNDEDQWESIVEINYSLFTKEEVTLESSIVYRLLPIFVQFISSKNEIIREHGELLLASIVKPISDSNIGSKIITENVKIVLGSDIGILILVKLLSSSYATVVDTALLLLHDSHIVADIPNVMLKREALKQVVLCLRKYEHNEIVLKRGIKLLLQFSYDYVTNARYIVDAGGIEVIMKLLSSSTDNSINIDAMEIIINVVSCNIKYCQKILAQNGIMNCIKKFSKMESFIRLLAYQFLEEVTKYGEKQSNFIIAEGFIEIIFQELKDGIILFDVKVTFLRIFDNIITYKPQYFLTLMNEHKMISILINNLQQQPNGLIINILSLLIDIMEIYGYRQIEKELSANWGKTKIQNLLRHENEKVRELAAVTDELFKIKPEAYHIDMSDSVSDANEEERESIVGRKRLSSSENSENSDEPQTINKRARTSTERSLSVTVDGDEGYDDFDIYSMISYSTEESNDEIESKPYPLHPPPEILLNLPEDEPTPEFGNLPQNNGHFDAFKFYFPSAMFLDLCCEKLGLEFDQQKYIEFFANIKMKQINWMSMPATMLPSNGKSGFECFSLFLTGEENNAEKIREEIIKYFMDLNKNEIIDDEKEAEIRGNSITNEHLRTISSWWNCKIMVFSDDYWQIYGNWEDKTAPVFVLQKEMADDQICYQIVTSLFD